MNNIFIPQSPIFVNWNFTYKCNLNCKHCYTRSPSYPKELSEAEYQKIADILISNKILKVGFGGGEPFIRKDFMPIVNRLSEAGIEVLMTSNGYYINNNIANQLSGANIKLIAISLDSVNKTNHNKIRGRDDSYDVAISAIKSLQKQNLNVFISFVVSKKNYEELDDLAALALKLNIKGVHIKLFRPSGKGLLNKEEFELEEGEIKKIQNKINLLQKSSSLNISYYQMDAMKSCSCGFDAITLRPNGDLSYCPYQTNTIGNIQNDKLLTLWEEQTNLRLNKDDGTCLANKPNIYPSNPYIDKNKISPKILENLLSL